mmetsp:Transcript_19044/g.67253  ORF Transcript_19044/g.67253 Transcript_19044/m.67253 type:complete len:269 (+) Transcript_19044:1042-1848(+)
MRVHVEQLAVRREQQLQLRGLVVRRARADHEPPRHAAVSGHQHEGARVGTQRRRAHQREREARADHQEGQRARRFGVRHRQAPQHAGGRGAPLDDGCAARRRRARCVCVGLNHGAAAARRASSSAAAATRAISNFWAMHVVDGHVGELQQRLGWHGGTTAADTAPRRRRCRRVLTSLEQRYQLRHAAPPPLGAITSATCSLTSAATSAGARRRGRHCRPNAPSRRHCSPRVARLVPPVQAPSPPARPLPRRRTRRRRREVDHTGAFLL